MGNSQSLFNDSITKLFKELRNLFREVLYFALRPFVTNMTALQISKAFPQTGIGDWDGKIDENVGIILKCSLSDQSLKLQMQLRTSGMCEFRLSKHWNRMDS